MALLVFAPAAVAQTTPADEPLARTDANSITAHEELVEKARSGQIDLYFAGDSITRRWGALDYPDLLEHWNATFFGWNAANFAWGGDRTENILWRIDNGEFEGLAPGVIVLLAGTNNIGRQPPVGDDAPRIGNITRGIETIVERFRVRAPQATIIVMGIFPRSDNVAALPTIEAINRNLSEMADGDRVVYLNINDALSSGDGRLLETVTDDGLHLSLGGYRVWARALEPLLTRLLGPRGSEDHAPPPTGNPAARGD